MTCTNYDIWQTKSVIHYFIFLSFRIPFETAWIKSKSQSTSAWAAQASSPQQQQFVLHNNNNCNNNNNFSPDQKLFRIREIILETILFLLRQQHRQISWNVQHSTFTKNHFFNICIVLPRDVVTNAFMFNCINVYHVKLQPFISQILNQSNPKKQ